MDSPRPPAPPTPSADAPPGAVARLQRLVPAARALVRTVRLVGITSAASAVVLWGLLAQPWTWGAGPPAGGYVLSFVGLALLLVPAGAAFLGVLTLEDVLALPGRLRTAAAETVGHARTAVATGEGGRRRRAFGFFRAIWGARNLVLDSKGAWLKAGALARLASLPFVLALLGAFALNAVVILAAALAVLAALLG